MNLFEFTFAVSLVFFVSGFITWLRYMVYNFVDEVKEQKNIFIEKNEKIIWQTKQSMLYYKYIKKQTFIKVALTSLK